MESWPVLPEAPLDAAGPASEAFRQIGCGSYRSAARHLHELPYGRNSDRADFMRVLSTHGLESIPEAHCYLTYAGHRVDVTRSGVAAQTAIARFDAEWAIEPTQIPAHKLALHHEYLRGWLRQQPDRALSFTALWRIREECILALGAV